MDRRTLVKAGAAAAATAALPLRARAQAAPSVIRIGYAISLSGPFAPGAESTSWSQYKLWAKDVNDAGGLYLKKFDRKVPIELIQYDDRSQMDEMLKLVERLVTQDKVDLVLPPWGTGLNTAAAAQLQKHGYPAIYYTSAGRKVPEMAARWNHAFFTLVMPEQSMGGLAQVLAQLKKEGKIKGRVAMVNVAEQLGVDLSTVMVEQLKKQNLELVFNKSYPIGTQDLSPLVREAKAADPDAFLAMSYPTDTFMLTEQSQVLGFSPAVFYAAVGAPFPAYRAKFGSRTDGVMTMGGVQPGAPGQAEYRARHKAMYNRETEIGAVGMYASLQVLQQAIEKAGAIDRQAIRDEIARGTFQTIAGQWRFNGQLLDNPYAVSQWQAGEVVPIAPAGKPGVQPIVFPKPAWG